MIELSEISFNDFTAYALYRLPSSECFSVIAQRSLDLFTADKIRDMANMKGFFMIPFAVSEQCPIVCIRPEVCYFIDFQDISNSTPSIVLPDKWTSSMYRGEKDVMYEKVFDTFYNALHRGDFEKLVLSRKKRVSLPVYNGIELFLRACKKYPRMMVYLCYTPISGLWLGCTPELLLSGEMGRYKTVALAGTVSMEGMDGGTPLWSGKELREQRIVVDHIKECLNSYCIHIEEKGPYNFQAGHLFHLQSDFTFSFRKDGCLCRFLECLYPTPAVCGIPQNEALRFIVKHEGYNRKYYSGAIGMFDAEGKTDLYVNLRCAHLFSRTADLYAGGGLLNSSTAESEWNETEDKLKTIADVLKQA